MLSAWNRNIFPIRPTNRTSRQSCLSRVRCITTRLYIDSPSGSNWDDSALPPQPAKTPSAAIISWFAKGGYAYTARCEIGSDEFCVVDFYPGDRWGFTFAPNGSRGACAGFGFDASRMEQTAGF